MVAIPVSSRTHWLVWKTSGVAGPPPVIKASWFGSAATDGYQRSACMSGPRRQVSVRQSNRCVVRRPCNALSLLPPATSTVPSASWVKPAQKML